jgi:hypothetical protein
VPPSCNLLPLVPSPAIAGPEIRSFARYFNLLATPCQQEITYTDQI